MSIQKFMRQFLVLAGFAVLASHILPAKELSFSYQPPLAGKACLAEDGFKVKRTLATVALAPEFQLPVEQIVLRAYEETWNIHIAYSGLLANEKTNAWFEGNPTWKKMPSETAKN